MPIQRPPQYPEGVGSPGISDVLSCAIWMGLCPWHVLFGRLFTLYHVHFVFKQYHWTGFRWVPGHVCTSAGSAKMLPGSIRSLVFASMSRRTPKRGVTSIRTTCAYDLPRMSRPPSLRIYKFIKFVSFQCLRAKVYLSTPRSSSRSQGANCGRAEAGSPQQLNAGRV